jgi:hypothetical protein
MPVRSGTARGIRREFEAAKAAGGNEAERVVHGTIAAGIDSGLAQGFEVGRRRRPSSKPGGRPSLDPVGARGTAGAEEEPGRSAQDRQIRDARRRSEHIPSSARTQPRAGTGGSLTAILASQEQHQRTTSIGMGWLSGQHGWLVMPGRHQSV